ncbi:5-formyltetrahydrofolate cyclo-ligase [Kineococcus sp. SYSU DK003]|uniref:5-formyltetrahydrofolate cyclo-ligase n=1 Tax=Kineococcus sp. SYSU DK003 TaxID=3383124 RepID=UPI003D7D0500
MTTGPAYAQVAAALRELALTHPWEDDGPLPAESVLTGRFGVSRGTLRRATEELVRDGLLSSEPGRGTYVRRHAQLRALIGERLRGIAIPDSRWHLDVHAFVPDFAGSQQCLATLRERAEYRAADLVVITPDNSLRALVRAALDDGKTVVVPTYGLRRGFVRLDASAVPAEHREFAATLDGLERFGTTLDLAALRVLSHVDLLVTGAVAFSTDGVHVGSESAYLDLEWGILAELGLADAATAVVGIAHDEQVVSVPLQPLAGGVRVDTVLTPSRSHENTVPPARPAGITWNAVGEERLTDNPYLKSLRPAPGERTAPLKGRTS